MGCRDAASPSEQPVVPGQVREGFSRARSVRAGALGPSGQLQRWLQGEGEAGLLSSLCLGRCEQPVGPGGRSCSRAQGIADRQRWGQEGIFPRATLALLPGVFLPSSAARSMTSCQGRAPLLCRASFPACCSQPAEMALIPCSWAEEGFFPPKGS